MDPLVKIKGESSRRANDSSSSSCRKRRQPNTSAGIAPAQVLKTLVHEIGHALLHGDDVVRTREIQEVEVESVAYVVLDALGIESDAYSFSYVARWSEGNVDRIKQSAERSISCARQILAGLELGSSDLAVEVAAPSA